MSSPAFELKGTAAMLTVLRLKTTDSAHIKSDLEARVSQLPQFFENAPVIVDCATLPEGQRPDFAAIVALVRACKMVPVAVRGVEGHALEQALQVGLGVLKGTVRQARDHMDDAAQRERNQKTARAVETPSDAPLADRRVPPDVLPPMVVRKPLRGGQVTYAQQTDLIVVGPVNAGAEVIADGNIHAYGPLRGRALAGAHGNLDACIFCSSLEAELVSIAGNYLMAEDLPETLRGQPAQVYLDGTTVRVEPIK